MEMDIVDVEVAEPRLAAALPDFLDAADFFFLFLSGWLLTSTLSH